MKNLSDVKQSEDHRVWIIQDGNGSFYNENSGFGGDEIAEFTTHEDAIEKAEFLSNCYKKSYYVFELTDQVAHQSIIKVKNLRQ